jgi:hypothetical protein
LRSCSPPFLPDQILLEQLQHQVIQKLVLQKDSHGSTSTTDIPAMTAGATEIMVIFSDHKENRPLLIFRVGVSISMKAKSIVQSA